VHGLRVALFEQVEKSIIRPTPAAAATFSDIQFDLAAFINPAVVLNEATPMATDVVGGFVGGPNAPIPGVTKERFNVNVVIENTGTAPDVAVCDARSGAVRVLALPSVTAPVLEAYGARWGRTLPPDAADHSGQPLGAARRTVLEDLVRHFMHP
jgi:hypothetical protein